MRSGEPLDTYSVGPNAADSSLTGADAYDVNRMRQSALNTKSLLKDNTGTNARRRGRRAPGVSARARGPKNLVAGARDTRPMGPTMAST